MNSRVILRVAAVALLLAAQTAHAILPIQHWVTKNGARVYFVENHDLPMFDLSVEFPAGAAFDTPDKSGAAGMTNQMLKRGANGMDEEQIARRLGDVGAQLGSQFGTDGAGLSLRSLSDPALREPALEVFARILRQPEFPATALEREKVRLIASLKEADTKPETIASRTFYRMVYRDHPYALRASGEVPTVAQLTREDLRDFYRRQYSAQRAVVAIMGDLSRAEAEAIGERMTSGLPVAQKGEFTLPPVPDLAQGATRIVRHSATQAHIMIGAPGIRRDDPDYFPLFVGNYILGGGGFVSRLNNDVRQKRGLAYAVYSYFSPLRQKGPFVIGMQTQREQADEALAVVRDTLRNFVSNGPSETELAAAKDNIIGGFPLRIDSNRKIHEYLGLIGFYDLPLSYLEDFVKNVDRVTAADIKDAFARRVDPQRLVTVVVGAEAAAGQVAR